MASSPVKIKSPAPVDELIRRLRETYPHAECSLDFKNPFELLVATILSAQCTDLRVNIVTPSLFKKFPNPAAMAAADQETIEDFVRTTGFFRAKAKSLRAMSQDLVDKHKGQVPQSIEDLTALRGVGRKTANVVLGNAFHNPQGVVVDTHVKRLSFRLGLTKQTDPEKIEKELNLKVPRKDWVDFPHWLIQHGRKICTARAPQCPTCPLNSICPKRGVLKKFQ